MLTCVVSMARRSVRAETVTVLSGVTSDVIIRAVPVLRSHMEQHPKRVVCN